MRERTTWNRNTICRLASALRTAEDPTAMNQDHIKQQPAADKYVTGDPSSFAEDVHPSTGTWKAEYSGDEVKRNEIGLPEMRGDTFNHKEKTAADDDDDDDGDDDEFLEKKAEVCLGLARRVLAKTASESVVEDQAFAFMHLPDAALIETVNRLASQEEDDDKDQQQKQGGKIPPQFLENIQKKKDEAKDDKGEDKGQQQKEAQGQQQQDDGDKGQQQQQKQAQGQQQQDEDKGQQQQKEAQGQQQQQDEGQQQKQAQQDQISQLQQQAQQLQDQIAQLVQQSQLQQQQSQLQQQQGQLQGQPAPVMSDDQMLDQLIQQQTIPQQQQFTASDSSSFDIQLEGPSIDTGVHLGSEDEALSAIFASHSEVREAAQAQALQTGIPVQASIGMTRTASTRTVGTRPSAGVSQLGGNTSSGSRSEVDKLAGLWQSAPDVSSVFD
jgi:hypothetical protein